MGVGEFTGFEDYVRTHECVVLQDVDGHDHIGGGRAFNHSALYWHKREPVIPTPGELGRGGSVPVIGGESGQTILDKTGGETKNLDENVQEITSNMKDYSICVGNFEILIQGTNSLFSRPGLISSLGKIVSCLIRVIMHDH